MFPDEDLLCNVGHSLDFQIRWCILVWSLLLLCFGAASEPRVAGVFQELGSTDGNSSLLNVTYDLLTCFCVQIGLVLCSAVAVIQLSQIRLRKPSHCLFVMVKSEVKHVSESLASSFFCLTYWIYLIWKTNHNHFISLKDKVEQS